MKRRFLYIAMCTLFLCSVALTGCTKETGTITYEFIGADAEKAGYAEGTITFETKEQNDVFQAVCDLPQNYRTVIYLLYYEGYKVKEISELMKKSEGTIKTWLFRAREILKQNLEGGFENE